MNKIDLKCIECTRNKIIKFEKRKVKSRFTIYRKRSMNVSGWTVVP